MSYLVETLNSPMSIFTFITVLHSCNINCRQNPVDFHCQNQDFRLVFISVWIDAFNHYYEKKKKGRKKQKTVLSQFPGIFFFHQAQLSLRKKQRC